MDDLRQLLFEKTQVGKVLEALRNPKPPDPATDPCRALLFGHALWFYGDFQQALEIYSTIPRNLSYEAERLWGLANSHLRLGNLKEVKPFLEESLLRNPSSWLQVRICNTFVNLHIFGGDFEQAIRAIDQGLEIARRGHHLTEQLILEGNRGIVSLYQGKFEEGIFPLERAARQLTARGCVLSAANFWVNLSGAFHATGAMKDTQKCLNLAEKLIQESGTRGQLIFLKELQGEVWDKEGLLPKAEQAFEQGLELIREFPRLIEEIQLTCDLAHLQFKKGNLEAALSLIRKALRRAQEKGFRSWEDTCLGYEGKFLVRSGKIQEGLAVLNQARESAESMGKWYTYTFIVLELAFGYWESKQREQALQWLKNGLEAAERGHMLPALLRFASDILTSLLLAFDEELTPTDFLSKLVVQLRHPVLLKRLLRHSPQGKVLFLMALRVHEARHFRPQLARLKDDPDKEVRRTSRVILNGWHHHTNYRVYTFGAFRVFLEGNMLTGKDWIQPGVKRLFLCFASHPEEWHSIDTLLETLWSKPHPKRTYMVLAKLFSYLRTVFEPWHLPDMDYVFFQSQRGAYGFFPGERFWIDYQEFEKGIKQAEQAQFKHNFKEARKAYRDALELYLGDYLEDFPYEDWLNPKRDFLRELYYRGVMRYATLERDSGNLPEARRVLEEALFKDLSRSGCAALLIQVLVQMKLSQEAREWGQRHITYMKKELKEKPAPEVVEALGKLR